MPCMGEEPYADSCCGEETSDGGELKPLTLMERLLRERERLTRRHNTLQDQLVANQTAINLVKNEPLATTYFATIEKGL